jgi:hypothetical protein
MALVTLSGVLAVIGTACEPWDSGGGGDELPRVISVPGNREGTEFRAPMDGTYVFTIQGGAYSAGGDEPPWFNRLYVYVNRPVAWAGGPGSRPVAENAKLGNFNAFPTRDEAAGASRGSTYTVGLRADEFITLVVPDSLGDFGDNVGVVELRAALAL